MRELNWNWYAIAAITAAFAGGLSWWHIWTDHRILHELVGAYQQHDTRINEVKTKTTELETSLGKKVDRP